MTEHDQNFPANQEHASGADADRGSHEKQGGRLRRYPHYVYNPISLTGAAVAISLACAVLLLFFIDITSEESSPYLGIIGFAVLPVPLILSLLAIPLGMWRTWSREQRGDRKERPLPVFDLNKPPQQRALLTFVVGTFIFVLLTAAGSYKAYEYTESVAFCGTFCHTVMEPEYVTYQHGPHARVKCVQCHIGEGADWFVRAKISGSYQFYSVAFNQYPRPIPTPIENLRPARETCEKCHWPAKFHGDQMWEVSRYLGDQENTRWPIRMVMKTGGAEGTSHEPHGIHWHISEEVEYVAADPSRTEIREVRHYRTDGTVDVYHNPWNPIGDEERSAIPHELIRVMDCMDCHNRPSHQYLSPRRAMDQALETGRISTDLPFIKQQGTDLLAAEYETREQGVQAIQEGLHAYYASNDPQVVTARSHDLDRAVDEIQELFRTYFFPYMGARWDVYPEHIGHFEYPGCFRCHNGQFATDDGRIIRDDCQLCHTILAQGPGIDHLRAQGIEGLSFVHPVDIGEAWQVMACYECHTGGRYD